LKQVAYQSDLRGFENKMKQFITYHEHDIEVKKREELEESLEDVARQHHLKRGIQEAKLELKGLID